MHFGHAVLIFIMNVCNFGFFVNSDEVDSPDDNSDFPAGIYASFSRNTAFHRRSSAGNNNMALTSSGSSGSCPIRCTGCPASCFKTDTDKDSEAFDKIFPGLFKTTATLEEIDMKTFGRKLVKKTELQHDYTISKIQSTAVKQNSSDAYKRKKRDVEDEPDGAFPGTSQGSVRPTGPGTGSGSGPLIDGDICCPAELTRFQPMGPIMDINGEMYYIVQLDKVQKYQSVTVSECRFNGMMDRCPGQCVTTMGVFTLLAFCLQGNACSNKVDSTVSFEQFELPTGCICKNFNG